MHEHCGGSRSGTDGGCARRACLWLHDVTRGEVAGIDVPRTGCLAPPAVSPWCFAQAETLMRPTAPSTVHRPIFRLRAAILRGSCLSRPSPPTTSASPRLHRHARAPIRQRPRLQRPSPSPSRASPRPPSLTAARLGCQSQRSPAAQASPRPRVAPSSSSAAARAREMNHGYPPPRAMVPQGGPSQRLNELLDNIRTEFETESQRSVDYEGQITRHIQEIELIRSKVYSLENQHNQMKAKYEDRIAQLERELEQRGGPSQSAHHHGPAQPQPPQIGHGPSNLFGGIMAGSASQGGPGLAPPPQDANPPHGMPPQLGGGPQGPPGLNPAPGPPQHFGGYQPGPAANGYGQPPPPTASPSGKRPGPPRGPPGGPATPQQNNPAPYPGSPQVPRPTPPPHHQQSALMAPHQPPLPLAQTNCLADLDVEQLPAQYKREGDDWYAVFNPRARRVLDVDLIHNLPHQSVVCCVRFSLDGRYVATGCNRSAQIFDVETGNPVAHLQDGSLPEDGDLYIRSVCFSPNGQYLATGAEDKVIRVWDIQTRTIKHQFTGHEQDIYSLDFARNGRIIASGSGDRSVRLWDLESNSQIANFNIEDGVTTVAISPDNLYVAAGSLDKSVRVWDIQSGQLVVRLEGQEGHKDSVYSVAFAPSGGRLVSGSLDKTIKMWELTTPTRFVPGNAPSGKCVRTFEGHKDFVLSVALTPHGDWVLSGSKDRGVQFWDPHTGVAQLMLQGHKNSVISVAPSPTGGVFATGSGDMRARIWKFDRYNGP